MRIREAAREMARGFSGCRKHCDIFPGAVRSDGRKSRESRDRQGPNTSWRGPPMASTRTIVAIAFCLASFLEARAATPDPGEGHGAQPKMARASEPDSSPESLARTRPLPALAAYRAVYTLSLAHATGPEAPTSAHGRIDFDFSGSACNGYAEKLRQVTEMQPATGPARVADLRSATFESSDGANFRFKIDSKVNGQAGGSFDGKAKRAPGAALAVEIARPNRQRVNLPGEALFPAEHLRRLVASAQAGEVGLHALIVDGSEEGLRIFSTNAIIGKAISASPAGKALPIDALKNLRHWPVTVSYFEPEAQEDQQPLHVMSFDLYENGVTGSLKIDYGDFTLAGELTELALGPAPTACKR
jgi:hypothetical protein